MLALHLGAVELRCPGPATPVLRIPELRVPAGDRIAVTGPSGSGQSTLVNITAGLERLRRVQVRWGGADIARLPEGARDRWRAANVGIVLQKFHLFPAPVPKTTCFCPPASVGSRGEMQRVAVARAPAHPRHHRGRRAHRHPRSRQRRGDRPVAGRACRAVGGHTDPRVERAAPIGLGGVHVGHPIVGATTDLIRNTGPDFLAGRRFAARGEAVVGSAVALAVGSSIVPSHGQAAAGGHAHAGLSHAVTGRLAPTGTPWDRAILVPIQAIWHIHGRGGHEDAQDAVQPGGEAHDGHAEDQPGGKGHNPGSIEPAAPLVERWRPGEAPRAAGNPREARVRRRRLSAGPGLPRGRPDAGRAPRRGADGPLRPPGRCQARARVRGGRRAGPRCHGPADGDLRPRRRKRRQIGALRVFGAPVSRSSASSGPSFLPWWRPGSSWAAPTATSPRG